MGFADLWVLFDAENADIKRSINKHICCENLSPTNPWLVLDHSNITYSVSRLSGGNYRVFEKYCEAFWRAVYFSKFRILVVKDGAHNGERGVIKLHRMAQKARYLDPNREEDVVDSTLFYEASEIRRRVLLEATAELGPGLIAQEIVAPQEADDEIRRFCKDIKTDVLILSNDTSLVLGLDDNKYIVSMSRLVLSPKAGHKYPLLYGPALKLGVLCTMWCKFIYKSHFEVGLRGPIIEDLKRPPRPQPTGDGTVSPINADSLILVSCLLEGEYEEYDRNEIANGTYHILNFLKNYCFPFSSPMRSSTDRYDKRKLDFVIACTMVMLFARSQMQRTGSAKFDSFDGFEVVLEEVKRAAAAVMVQDPSGQIMLGELTRKNNGQFNNVCDKTAGIDVEGVMSVLRNRLSLLTGKDNNNSVVASGPERPLYFAEWGTWMFSEPVSPGHCTHAILHPFVSLMRQIVVARHFPAAVVVEPCEPGAAVEAFNEFLRRLLSTADEARIAAGGNNASVVGTSPQVWVSRLHFNAPATEEVGVYTKVQVFDHVSSSQGRLPECGLLATHEASSPSLPSPSPSAGASSSTSPMPPSPVPSNNNNSSSAAGVYVAYSAPRPQIHWQVVDSTQYATDILHTYNYGEHTLPICDGRNDWNNNQDGNTSGALINLSERSKLLSRIASGELGGSSATTTSPARLAHPFIEVLLEAEPALAEVSKPIHKFWKKYCAASFDDKDQCKSGSLGASLALHGFGQTYDRWVRQPGHAYTWAGASSADKILDNLVDAVLLGPIFARHVGNQTAVTDGIEKNLKRVIGSIQSKVPEKLRTITRSTYRWVEILQYLVKETLIAAKNDTDSCGKDLFSWFDGIGIATVLQMGLKAESYFPAHQCAALWCEELREFMGFKESELEAVVSALAECRLAVVTLLRK